MLLNLGPIVGHTTESSTRIWIQTLRNPKDFQLRIKGVGIFEFVLTDPDTNEFGTGIAYVDNLLRSDRIYHYDVLYNGLVIPGGNGTFRTMPDPNSEAEYSFCFGSCIGQNELGIAPELLSFIERAKPRCLILLGDQVYTDDKPNIWPKFINKPGTKRRKAIADKYVQSWKRPELRRIMANIPTYMLWDDHEIRDGWGSYAPDSPTLAANPGFFRGIKIHDKYNLFFRDTRDVYQHFQMCHNPDQFNTTSNTLLLPVSQQGYKYDEKEDRLAFPYMFRVAKTLFVIIDGRGARDVWRPEYPILGQLQWRYLREHLLNLSPDIHSIVFATQVGVCMSPKGLTQTLIGGHTEDVDAFKKGSESALNDIFNWNGSDMEIILNAIGAGFNSIGINNNTGDFRLSDLDDARDQWVHSYSISELKELITLMTDAAFINRPDDNPRKIILLAGDLHAGGEFEINVVREKKAFKFDCIISSGISKRTGSDGKPIIGALVDEEFRISDNINVRIRNFVNNKFNFGFIQVIPDGDGTTYIPSINHEGNANVWGIQVGIQIPFVNF